MRIFTTRFMRYYVNRHLPAEHTVHMYVVITKFVADDACFNCQYARNSHSDKQQVQNNEDGEWLNSRAFMLIPSTC